MAISDFGRYNFKNDIEIGKSAEELISKIILERDNSVIKILPNENSKYDLMVLFNDETCCTIEVKNDVRSQITGNVAVEIFSRGKKSGVFSSEADYFVYFVRDNGVKIFITRRTKLLELIRTCEFRRVFGGDVDSSGKPTTEMVLIPKNIFYNNAIDITNRNKYSFGIRRYYGYDR